jgi:hypothetical protein
MEIIQTYNAMQPANTTCNISDQCRPFLASFPKLNRDLLYHKMINLFLYFIKADRHRTACLASRHIHAVILPI